MYKSRQRGAALLVSLLFLLIFTILGISAMKNSIFQEKLVANYNNQIRTFQAAESSVDMLMSLNSLNDLMNAAIDGTSAATQSVTLYTEDNALDNVTSTATMDYIGASTPSGYSLGGGGSGTTVVKYTFSVIGTGTFPDVNAESQVERGVYKIAPGGT